MRSGSRPAAAFLLALLALGPGAMAGDDDETVWPNKKSRANSDAWLVQNHDKLRLMKPRVLVLNFANGLSREEAAKKVDELRSALGVSSRWHGGPSWAARSPRQGDPAFLDYQVAKQVELTDRDSKDATANSSLYPTIEGYPASESFGNFDYTQLTSDAFTKRMAWEDPEKKGSLLSLKDLVERGLVHEVWMLCHHEKARAPFETVEAKQLYDEKLARKDGHTLDAGNSGDTSHVPWLGRSLRILFFNPDRGCGCAMESLGHSLEHMATSDAIPYFKKYFVEYAMLDLDKRYGLPFDSLYAKGPLSVSYPTPTSMIYRREGKDRTLEGYVVSGGNVHFVPNGRTDYDMTNDQPVRSTIGHWRERDGEGGKDRSELWLPAVLEPYEKVAPDCMGKWVVYWRQRMPGLDNAAKDDDGKPMKNWWPFLFY